MEKIRSILVSKPDKVFRVGSVLEFTYEDSNNLKVRRFTGICIGIVKRNGIFRYTLRNVLNGIPIELSFDHQSPLTLSLRKAAVFKLVSTTRSKLFYLRSERISLSRV